MDHRRRRNGHLRRLPRHGLQELEVARLNVGDVAKLASHRKARRGEVDYAAAAVELRLDPAAHRDPLQLFEEVDVKEGPAELAVRDALEADVFLPLHDVADVRVLDRAQLFGGDVTVAPAAARFEQRRRAQQAPDVIGTEGWIQFG